MEVAEHAELFLYDLKHMDSILHRKYTGVPNELILHNLELLSREHPAVRIRIPLLAGINDDDNNIRAIGVFAAGLNQLEGIDILPYHNFASSKYTKLKENYQGTTNHTPGKEKIAHVQAILEDFGHTVSVGG